LVPRKRQEIGKVQVDLLRKKPEKSMIEKLGKGGYRGLEKKARGDMLRADAIEEFRVVHLGLCQN
jgi:hypothetical protein